MVTGQGPSRRILWEWMHIYTGDVEAQSRRWCGNTYMKCSKGDIRQTVETRILEEVQVIPWLLRICRVLRMTIYMILKKMVLGGL